MPRERRQRLRRRQRARRGFATRASWLYSPQVRILALVGAFSIALPLAAGAFKEGPYPNVTGGFGEQSCHTCHLDNPINAPGGQLQIAGVPRAYAAGEPYRITIALARDRLERAGFEIAARFAAGRPKGKQAGTWGPGQ